MATRGNPFYRYQNPALGSAFAGIAEAMFPQPDKTQSEIAAKEAQAAASYALAAERDQNTRGKAIKNERYSAMPTDLAALFLSGGQFQDEPMSLNPNYEPPAPIDFGALIRGEPLPEIQSPVISGRTAVDQFASALQQMEAYGFRPDQIMDAIGKNQYLGRATGANPQDALPFMPFVGGTPTAGTALSATAQNRISARDAQEALTQATQVEGMRSQNRLDIEGIREDGRNTRGTGRTGTGTGSASAVPNVTPKTAESMRASLESRLKQLGYRNIEPQAVDEVLGVATRLFQDRNSDAFKNTALAVQEAVDMVEMGQLPGVSEVTSSGFFGGQRRDLTRVPPGQRPAAPAPAAPAPAAARPDPAKVQGMPAGATIGRQPTPQGWEVFDRNGKLIGYIQE